MEKVPFMLVTGDKEQEDGTVSVRIRKDGDKGSMTIPDFISLIKEHIDTKMID